MIKIGKGIIIWTLVFFLCQWLFEGFNVGVQLTISIVGMIYYTYNIAYVYLRVKENRFNFKQAASIKEWIRFLVSNIIIWSLFLLFLSERLILFVVIMTHVLLIILLIYDVIRTLIKKIFS